MKNISKIISNLFLSFSFLFLCYVLYRSEIHHDGNQFGYYLKYYIIALILIIVSIVSFFIPKNIKINISVFIISILIGLYLVEAYLNIKHKKISTYKKLTGKDYDLRTKFEIYNDLKKENPNIVVSPPPSHFVDDLNFDLAPLSGIANRKTIHCNENGYYSIYQSDRYGFNNPDEEWEKLETDYLLVGDSMTRGACVNEPDTFSGNLKKLKNNNNGVLNLGQTGNGPLRQYATLREYLPHKNVKRVIWLFSEGNDLIDLNNELKHQILIKYLKNKNFNQNLLLRNKEVQKLLISELSTVEEKMRKNYIFEQKTKRSFFVNFLTLKKIRIYYFESLFHEYNKKKYVFNKQEFTKVIILSNQLAYKNKSKFYFIYMPLYMRFQLNNDNDNYQHYNEVLKIINDLNIPIIDIKKEVFDKMKNPLELFPFKGEGHYNVKGYEIITKSIFNKINELEN